MPNFYTYLIASLPMLHFGATPPFSFNKFIEICQDKIAQDDTEILKLTAQSYAYSGNQATLKEWRDFETALRNELVKIRAGRRHIDPAKYLRGEGYVEPIISRIALNACRNPSVLDQEKSLDLQRWRKLDELEAGHYFDSDFLIVYALKLQIMERWEKIKRADAFKLIEGVIS
ncbi:MAG: hypothetical protein DRP74_03040 [Candidatus Omnitrophota bacterium]|mgnify:CR=1 FL=1|nr:MAG: hypothetical protein DRP74_03040 [Candidatus Omnitrophota bacterium]